MSPVIKAYIFIPIPVQITEKPGRTKYLEWQNHKPVSQKLSVLLYRWMSKRHSNHTLWN
jgi:hypothetical protein